MFDFFEEHKLNSTLKHVHFQPQYLHIPVCASSWGKTIFTATGFEPNGTLNQDYTTVVFLKDPIDRWLSGLATWLTYRLPQHTPLTSVRDNSALLDVLFDTVRQDDHTERQLFFLQNVDVSRAKFFLINDTFNESVNKYFIQNFSTDISNYSKENQTTLQGGKLIPKQYFRSVLESTPQYLDRVLQFFERDYQFLQKISFENPVTGKYQYYDI